MALNISVADANALNSNDKVLTGTQNYNSNIDGLKCGNAGIIHLYGHISYFFRILLQPLLLRWANFLHQMNLTIVKTHCNNTSYCELCSILQEHINFRSFNNIHLSILDIPSQFHSGLSWLISRKLSYIDYCIFDLVHRIRLLENSNCSKLHSLIMSKDTTGKNHFNTLTVHCHLVGLNWIWRTVILSLSGLRIFFPTIL